MNSFNTINNIKSIESGLFSHENNGDAWSEFSEGLLNYRMSKNATDPRKEREFLLQAVKNFTQFISLKPDYNPAYSYLGISYYLLGKYKLALKALNESISMSHDSNNINLILYRGLTWQKLSEDKKALNDFSYIIEHAPDCRDAYYYRALLHIDAGHCEAAIGDLSSALNLDRERHVRCNETQTGYLPAEDLRVMRAGCYFIRRDYQNAIYDYTKVLEKRPDYGILCKRGECYYLAGDYNNALADLSGIAEHDPYNYEAFYIRGSVYIALSEYERSVSDFTSAVSLLLNNAKAFIRRAYAYSFLGSYTDALKDLETAKEIEPDNMELYRTYGVVFLQMHMRTKAAEYLRIAASLGDKVSQNWLKKKGFTLKEYGQI